MTKILLCSCKSEYQDTKYGRQMRVHNQKKKDKEEKGWMCTVCGNMKGR